MSFCSRMPFPIYGCSIPQGRPSIFPGGCKAHNTRFQHSSRPRSPSKINFAPDLKPAWYGTRPSAIMGIWDSAWGTRVGQGVFCCYYSASLLEPPGKAIYLGYTVQRIANGGRQTLRPGTFHPCNHSVTGPRLWSPGKPESRHGRAGHGLLRIVKIKKLLFFSFCIFFKYPPFLLMRLVRRWAASTRQPRNQGSNSTDKWSLVGAVSVYPDGVLTPLNVVPAVPCC
ncbi:hypothetical protein B0T24DRAFT_75928 [Lasiosphaeria ovina]|uniref:Uncharacterized protein n=1 Tax=Lasiosphaeria ovina TaxID=92902 RepID=A0AAE0NMB7_9PEZI|nr:hypothetical protein B0T24DRAFT_75928 [Lasiosphaeria ovina]